MCGWIGIGRSGSFAKTTSGGSGHGVSSGKSCRSLAILLLGALTDRVRRAEPKLEAVDLVQIEGILVEHADVQQPLFEVVCSHEVDPWREIVVDLNTALVGERGCLPSRPGNGLRSAHALASSFWSLLWAKPSEPIFARDGYLLRVGFQARHRLDAVSD